MAQPPNQHGQVAYFLGFLFVMAVLALALYLLNHSDISFADAVSVSGSAIVCWLFVTFVCFFNGQSALIAPLVGLPLALGLIVRAIAPYAFDIDDTGIIEFAALLGGGWLSWQLYRWT